MKNTWVKAVLRWVNLHPFWHRRHTLVWGNRLRAPTFDRWLALQLHHAGRMGVADRRFLQATVKPGMTVVDIGANQGLYTLLFADLVGERGRVLAFEPDDLLHDALRENVESNGARNVEVHHLALGSESGTMTLYRSLLNSGDNRLSATSTGGGPRDPVQVRIERLDEALAGERIDFVKIDVEGWEMEVFRGMQALLDAPANAQISIYFEFNLRGLRDAGSEPIEPLEFLEANGFTIYSFDHANTITPVRDLVELASLQPTRGYVNLYAVRSRL